MYQELWRTCTTIFLRIAQPREFSHLDWLPRRDIQRKIHLKNWYRIHHFSIRAISVFMWNLTWNSLVSLWIFLYNRGQGERKWTGFSNNWVCSFFQVVVIIFFLSLLAAGIYGALQVESGLDLRDVLPRKSLEYKFVEARLKYFSFYPVALVTQDFDYANQQKKLLSYYEEFKNVSG